MNLSTLLLFLVVPAPSLAFYAASSRPRSRRLLQLAASVTDTLALSLPKPLGLILEEIEEGQAAGVFVLDFGETGSAVEYANQLQGATLASVQGENVESLDFDAVMDKIVAAPETVNLEFFLKAASSPMQVGTKVTIQYMQSDGKQTELTAKVGDNLRQILLENGVEVYQGMKQQLGNCGGAGQCTFCAMDFLKSEGWAERSEYENQKLSKFPNARLACLNSIQGPATIQKTKR